METNRRVQCLCVWLNLLSVARVCEWVEFNVVLDKLSVQLTYYCFRKIFSRTFRQVTNVKQQADCSIDKPRWTMAKSALQSRYVRTIREVSVQVNGFQSDSVPSHGRTCSGDDHVIGDVTVTRTRPSSPHECCRQRDTATHRTHPIYVNAIFWML